MTRVNGRGFRSNRMERGERGFVGTKFFGFKFPRKLALQNYSQLPRRAPNLSMASARVCTRYYRFSMQPARNSVEKYLQRTSFPYVHVHTAAYVQIARCTNRSIIRPVIEQFFPNRGADIVRAEIYAHSLGEISLEIAIEGTTTYNAICFN